MGEQFNITPERVAVAKEEWERVLRAVPESDREAFLLFANGFTLDEITEKIGLNDSIVREKLDRAFAAVGAPSLAARGKDKQTTPPPARRERATKQVTPPPTTAPVEPISEEDFSTLVAELHQRLRKRAKRLGCNDPDRAVQDLWLYAWERRESVQITKAWLFTVLKRIVWKLNRGSAVTGMPGAPLDAQISNYGTADELADTMYEHKTGQRRGRDPSASSSTFHGSKNFAPLRDSFRKTP